MNPYLKKPYTVVMREDPGKKDAVCVMAKPGPAFSRVLPVSREWEMVQDYAKSIGCQVMFFSQRRPKDSELVCILTTYRSGSKTGEGRMASTFHRWVVWR